MDNKEIWKDIYEDGSYSISNYGRVRSNARIIFYKNGIQHRIKEKILLPDVNKKDGHLRVTLCHNGVKERFLIHYLVAITFIPNPNNYPIINHKDENPINNYVDNLEWCSYSYNNTYNNLHKRRGDLEGHNIDVFDLNGKYIESFPSMTKAAQAYNISLSTFFRRVKAGQPENGYYFKEQNKV